MLDASCCQTRMAFYLFVSISSLISCVYCAPVYATQPVDYKLVCKSSYKNITTGDCQRCPVDGCETELLKDGCWKDVDHWYKTCFGDLGPCLSSRWYKNNDGTYGNMECRTRCPKVYETCSHVPILPTTTSIIPVSKPEPVKIAPTTAPNLLYILGPIFGGLSIIIITLLLVYVRKNKQKKDYEKIGTNPLLKVGRPHSAQGLEDRTRLPEENPTTREEENNPPLEHSADDGDVDIGANGVTNSEDNFARLVREKWEAWRVTAASDLKVQMVCVQESCSKGATHCIDSEHVPVSRDSQSDVSVDGRSGAAALGASSTTGDRAGVSGLEAGKSTTGKSRVRGLDGTEVKISTSGTEPSVQCHPVEL